MNNVDLFDGLNNVISYLPDPLGDILQKLKETQKNKSSFEFAHFFDTLNQDEKQYVSKLLLEHEEVIGKDAFQKLIIQFHKKQWKLIVRNIQTQLAHAKQEDNREEIDKILRDFQQLKREIVPAIMKNTVER